MSKHVHTTGVRCPGPCSLCEADTLDMLPILIYLGAEGTAEARFIPWLRDCTEEEIEAELRDHGGRFERLSIDSMGRPYFFVAITAGAPKHIREWAKNTRRAVRLP